MAAAQRAIPSHLRDGAATNGGEAGAFKRNHHQKSQSHMVSLYVPEKPPASIQTIESASLKRFLSFMKGEGVGGRGHFLRKSLLAQH